jgi:phospholipase C
MRSGARPGSSAAPGWLRVDPDHSHASVMAQLGIAGTPDAPPRNDGFVANYELGCTGRSPEAVRAGKLRRILNVAIVVLAVAGLGLLAVAWWLGLGVLALGGLALSFRERFVGPASYHPGDGPRIVWGWDPATLPALATLARSFTLCQHRYSSVPGDTWPNRQFAHAATSHGTVDIEVAPLP